MAFRSPSASRMRASSALTAPSPSRTATLPPSSPPRRPQHGYRGSHNVGSGWYVPYAPAPYVTPTNVVVVQPDPRDVVVSGGSSTVTIALWGIAAVALYKLLGGK